MAEGESGGAGMPGNRVLLVDDDEEVTGALGELLTRSGFQVTIAGKGAEALELLEGGRFDAMVLDLAMPGTGGVGVLAEIRRRHVSLPVIIYSSYLGVFDEDELREMGVSRVMMKPASGGEMVGALQEVIAQGSGAGEGGES